MIKVIIAEDDPIVRRGLNSMIEEDNEIEVVGSTGNGKAAYELWEKMRPDLVLMDVCMPLYNGIEGIRLIKEKDDSAKVLILTMFEDDEYINKAMQLGADGYILKGVNSQDLIGSIKRTVNGLNVVDCRVFKKIRENSNKVIATIGKGRTEHNLMPKELQIIKLIVEGKENREIAAIMHYTEGSVKNKVTAILRKFDLKDRTQLAIYAIMNNLVYIDS